jgi:hypothetical protein
VYLSVFRFLQLGEFRPRTRHKGPEEEYKYNSTLSLTSALDKGCWSALRLDRLTPGENPVTIVQKAGWGRGPVWTGAKISPTTGIRSPGRPARSKSPYRLSYPGPQILTARPEYSTPAFNINRQIFVTEMRCFLQEIIFIFFSVSILLLLALFISKLTFDIMDRSQARNTGLTLILLMWRKG